MTANLNEEIGEALYEAAKQCQFPLEGEYYDSVRWSSGWSPYVRIHQIDGHLAQHYVDMIEENT